MSSAVGKLFIRRSDYGRNRIQRTRQLPDCMTFEQVIIKAIENETARIVDEESKLAASRVESRIKEMTGEISARVVKHMSIEAFGHDQFKLIVQFKP